MANGYFERGEMYDILYSDGYVGEMAAHRPGIIVSSEAGNVTCPTVLMIHTTTTTTTNKNISVNHKFVMNGWTNYALCSQIVTINKNRLKKFYGKLSTTDMDAIDRCLEEALDLGYVDDTAVKEKEREIADRDVLIGDLKTEVAEVKAKIGQKDEEIASLKMEIEMWQKCYGRCMDMLVDTKVNGDFQRRTLTEPQIEENEEDAPNPPDDPPVEQEDRLDINTCTATALKKAGFSLAVARKIVESRPFTSVEDLKRINGLKANLYRILEPKLCCVPVAEPDPVCEVEGEVKDAVKVNVNTASAKEIMAATGVSETTAYSITGYRKKHGPYTCLEDLLNVKNFSKKALVKCRDLLEV